jgi:hypothetical protein
MVDQLQLINGMINGVNVAGQYGLQLLSHQLLANVNIVVSNDDKY